MRKILMRIEEEQKVGRSLLIVTLSGGIAGLTTAGVMALLGADVSWTTIDLQGAQEYIVALGVLITTQVLVYLGLHKLTWFIEKKRQAKRNADHLVEVAKSRRIDK